MFQTFGRLRGTNEPRCATPYRLGFACFWIILAHGMTAASGAMIWEHKGLRAMLSFFFNNRNDLRDHITRALNDNRITYTNIFAGNLIFIMQSRI